MATASKIKLNPDKGPDCFARELAPESATKASGFLQENHDQHHIFFNQSGFHNHIAHHLLTIYALGASPSEIETQYDRNKGYQRPLMETKLSAINDMHDPARFKDYLGQEKYYHDLLLFFQDEIAKSGMEHVLNEYLFKGDNRADDLLARTFAGFNHPLIHLGFGVEFQQPAIVAEAMAQLAVHDGNYLLPLFKGAEKAAAERSADSSKSLAQLLDEIRADERLQTAAHWDDGNKLKGLIERAADAMISHASQFTVTPDKLEEKTAEMINANIYFTGAAQNPKKVVMFDFYYIHCTNSAIFFSAFLKQPWISQSNKVRLLEWKARGDLALYASRRTPELLLDEINNYRPLSPADSEEASWNSIFDRVNKHNDDGHRAKLIRALAHGKAVCAPFEHKDAFVVKGDMWLQLAHMAIDSGESAGEQSWVRSAGFPEAWKDIQDRPLAVL